jgi:hypothetical protein
VFISGKITTMGAHCLVFRDVVGEAEMAEKGCYVASTTRKGVE